SDAFVAKFHDDSAATHLSVFMPDSTTAGEPLELLVRALDADNYPDTDYRGTIHFTSNDPQAVLPADYTYTAADKGIHTFILTFKTAGNRTVTATDITTGSLTGTATTIVKPAAAKTFQITGFPSSVTAGESTAFTVTAVDPYGNTASGYTGTVTFTSNDNQAALPANYTFTANDAGTHTFSATLKTAGTRTVTVTDINTAMLRSEERRVGKQAEAKTFQITGYPYAVTTGEN